MTEGEENQKPIAESHQEVTIRIKTRTRTRRNKETNRDYQTEKSIKQRNYGRKRAIKQKNYRKRG